MFGKANTSLVQLASVAQGQGGYVINGLPINGNNDGTGDRLSYAGDVNGDGLADMIIGANSLPAVGGKSYVVYGKADTTAISLVNVAAGTGGFVINSAASDALRTTVSNAGDLNGDGMDDLLVGAFNANSVKGASYVIFGGTQFASTVDFLGDTSANTLTGTSTAETFAAGTGNDTLIGNGGADVMHGGAGDDVFVLNATNVTALQNLMGAGGNTTQLARVVGGTGIDSIQMASGANLDLTLVSNIGGATPEGMSRISSIEIIDLQSDTAANTLSLQLRDVIDMSGMNVFNSGNTTAVGGTALTASIAKHQVAVYGDAFDTVYIGAGWTNTGTVVGYAGHNLVVYNSNTSAAQLFIEQAVVNASHVL